MESWEIEARLSIQATLSRYTRFVDAGRPDQLSLLFAEPMHYDMGGGRVVHSREDLIAHVEAIKFDLPGGRELRPHQAPRVLGRHRTHRT